ncbi:uncharacterized protein [Montipora foliosa]|uniref:uncharacterized protein n=1 Tax=Montipora foliosa TaxID=591990 RepID=UPI0035F1881C
MDKFVTRKPRKGDADLHTSSECDFDCEVQPPEKVGTTSSSTSTSQPRKRHGPCEFDCAVRSPEKIAETLSSSTNNKPNYKRNLTYDASWKKKHSWMNYDSTSKCMVCTVCKVYGKVPVQAKGAWVKRPVSNWVKATTLLANHQKSEWHSNSSMEKGIFSVCRTDCNSQRGRKERKPENDEEAHPITIENGDITLKAHRETCPRNAAYGSYSTIVELLASISKTLENSLLDSLIMVDESTDVASKEELSITFEKMRALGFDGATTMSGNRTGVQTLLRLHAPSAIYVHVHCHCHLLQLAALNAVGEHAEVKRVLGTLLTIWKALYYSPKKAEKLKEIQAELQFPEVKMQKKGPCLLYD